MVQRRSLARLTAEEILAALSVALEAEAQAAADYRSHARASGQTTVGEALEMLGEVEREHADRLADRIRALGGEPASLAPTAGAEGGSLAGWLAQDLAGEQWAIVEYARLVAGAVDDDETADLMAELLWDEIRHAVWLRATLRALEAAAATSE